MHGIAIMHIPAPPRSSSLQARLHAPNQRYSGRGVYSTVLSRLREGVRCAYVGAPRWLATVCAIHLQLRSRGEARAAEQCRSAAGPLATLRVQACVRQCAGRRGALSRGAGCADERLCQALQRGRAHRERRAAERGLGGGARGLCPCLLPLAQPSRDFVSCQRSPGCQRKASCGVHKRTVLTCTLLQLASWSLDAYVLSAVTYKSAKCSYEQDKQALVRQIWYVIEHAADAAHPLRWQGE